MRNAIRIITAIIVLSLTGSVVPAGSRSVGADPSIVLIGFGAAEQQLVFHAVDLFQQAGLPLPTVEIRRHHDKAPCHGFDGLYVEGGRGGSIHLCAAGSAPAVEHVVIHELGHAWSTHYLSAAHRAEFQKVRGWSVWLDYDRADWEDNGAEQASEIIVWALSDHAVPVLRIGRHTCAQLEAGYVALTGSTPLHGYRDLCDDRSASRRS